MKKYTNLILMIILALSFQTSYWAKVIINNSSDTIKINSNQEKEVDREIIFDFFASYYKDQIPDTYKYIELNFKDIKKEDNIYSSLQILVYLDLIKNTTSNVFPQKEMSAYNFYMLSEKIFDKNIGLKETKEKLQSRNTNLDDLYDLSVIIKDSWKIELKSSKRDVEQKILILKDVYETIVKWHYDKENLDEIKLLDSAIEWLTKWVWDRYTVYFPATESKNFYDTLNWEYEWIGSYVDMEEPGVLRIVTPIAWSPSERAWLKWWDIVTKVDSVEITKENSLWEVVSWIKWPAWTKVILTIKRWDSIFDIEVIREKIIIKEVDYELLNRNTFYIQIRTFWSTVTDEFKSALEEIEKNDKITKIIIDLRNNWWGYLDEVTKILWLFVEKWENTAVVKYRDWEKEYKSNWESIIDLNKYKVILLENSWTASASEIMIWTLKDYYPDITILWEKSYWKWSVQTIRWYLDWSSVKYTVAKWFTWKNQNTIDGVWIEPDIELELDLESFKDGYDNQLEKAKSLR